MPKYLVETISMYRMRYVVKAESADAARAHVADDFFGRRDLEEFSQLHIGESILSSRKIDTKEYIQLFDEDNDYLKDWTEEHKLSLINEIGPDC